MPSTTLWRTLPIIQLHGTASGSFFRSRVSALRLNNLQPDRPALSLDREKMCDPIAARRHEPCLWNAVVATEQPSYLNLRRSHDVTKVSVGFWRRNLHRTPPGGHHRRPFDRLRPGTQLRVFEVDTRHARGAPRGAQDAPGKDRQGDGGDAAADQ